MMATRVTVFATLACGQLGTYARAESGKEAHVPKPVSATRCQGSAEGEWEFVRDQQLGVAAGARNGPAWIGLTAATDGFHDWAPLDDHKTTICGQLDSFGIFEPNRDNPLLRFLPEIPEHDWNIIIIPTQPSIFDDRFKVATQLMERGHLGDLEVCSGGNYCFEAEITPPGGLLKASAADQWLNSCRRGQTVCVYGPWVGDGGHGYRPEIHPAERIWWRDGDNLKLFFVQDASQRFADRRQFQWKWGQGEPRFWQPWARPGLEGEFRLAFQMAKGSNAPFQVDQLLDSNTRPVDRSPALSFSVPLMIDGAPAGAVDVSLGLSASSDRLELDPSKVDVAPVGVCERADGTLQGYLSIHDKLGYRYQDGEGFDAFEVKAPPLPKGPASCEPTVIDTLAEDGHEPLRASVRITAEEVDTREAGSAGRERILHDLLIAATPDPQGQDEPTAVAPQQAAVLRTMTTNRADVDVRFARGVQLRVRPHYDGPRGERIEAAIDKENRDDLRRLLAVTHAQMPEKVEWTVDARDVTAGMDLPRDRVTRTCKQHLMVEDDCVFHFPASEQDDPAGHVIRVTATASLLDAAGSAITDSGLVDTTRKPPEPVSGNIRLASHFIKVSKSDSAKKTFAWLTADPALSGLVKLAEAKEEQGPVPDQKDLAPYRRTYYARMLRHGVSLATADGLLTLDEIAQFVQMAHAFRNPPALCGVRSPPKIK